MNNIEKITEIIRNVYEQDVANPVGIEIKPDMDLILDLNIDSLDMVLIISDIEEEFGISIENEDISGIRTIEDIEKKIMELKK